MFMAEQSKKGEKMKKIDVFVCVCAECMLSGAMDLICGIESLKKVPKASPFTVKIIPTTPLDCHDHSACAPVIKVEDEVMENATTQNVMAKILAHTDNM